MPDEIHRYTLLIPGPTECPEYVLKEMSMQVLPHYESEWAEIYWEIIADLQTVMGTEGDVFPINGTGTFSFEICMASLLRKGDKVLAIANSGWGQEIGNAAERFGADVTWTDTEWYQAVSRKQLDSYLADGDYQLVAAVHLDTGSGFLNPLGDIGAACREFDVPFLVDCVASLGGVPFEMDEWGVDFCCASVQKCMDSPPGIAIVGVSEKAWRHIDAVTDIQRGRYMDLRYWRKSAIENHDIHPNLVTSATNNLMALKASLRKILAEGLEAREDRARNRARYFRRGLKNLGLGAVLDDDSAVLVTKVVFPDEINPDDARNYLRFSHNLLVGVGFRVAHFGANISYGYLALTLTAMEEYLRSRGCDIPATGALEGLDEYRV